MKSLLLFISKTGKQSGHHCFGFLLVLLTILGNSRTAAAGQADGSGNSRNYASAGFSCSFNTSKDLSADTGTMTIKEISGHKNTKDKKSGVYKPQSITFKPFGQKKKGDADFDLEATASSGLSVNYSSTNPSVATVVDGKIRITGTGITLIIVSQEGDDTYDAAISVIRPLRVTATPRQ